MFQDLPAIIIVDFVSDDFRDKVIGEFFYKFSYENENFITLIRLENINNN